MLTCSGLWPCFCTRFLFLRRSSIFSPLAGSRSSDCWADYCRLFIECSRLRLGRNSINVPPICRYCNANSVHLSFVLKVAPAPKKLVARTLSTNCCSLSCDVYLTRLIDCNTSSLWLLYAVAICFHSTIVRLVHRNHGDYPPKSPSLLPIIPCFLIADMSAEFYRCTWNSEVVTSMNREVQ